MAHPVIVRFSPQVFPEAMLDLGLTKLNLATSRYPPSKPTEVLLLRLPSISPAFFMHRVRVGGFCCSAINTAVGMLQEWGCGWRTAGDNSVPCSLVQALDLMALEPLPDLRSFLGESCCLVGANSSHGRGDREVFCLVQTALGLSPDLPFAFHLNRQSFSLRAHISSL